MRRNAKASQGSFDKAWQEPQVKLGAADRQFEQMLEGEAAHAKVVQRDGHAQAMERVQLAGIELTDEVGFGDVQFQLRRRQAEPRQEIDHPLGEARCAELVATDVDAQGGVDGKRCRSS